jgi:integrase
MASIQVRKENNCLIIDFYYKNHRCREQTALTDTATNRKRVMKLIDKIEAEISLGTFEYHRFFPGSKNAAKFNSSADAESNAKRVEDKQSEGEAKPNTPLFREFCETWYGEKQVEWRHSHKINIRSDLDKVLIPRFGTIEVGCISKADILAFRAELAKVQARGKKTMLSNNRINRILNPLRQILAEAADRFDFRMPFQHIKQLKIRKTDVEPFTLDEVRTIIESVRPDFRNYFTVRFFTGMRTGEVDGLKWKFVDFERRTIYIRETIVAGREEYTKNDYSQRDIQMSQLVYDALKEMEKATRPLSEFVFCNRLGKPLDHKNITNRVWYPLLRHLGLKPRRPYQCRHTAATLWLASGEAPEWIARQLGHSTTEMLFRVYSRYVPNLTRKDGSAFERLLTGAMGNGDKQLQPVTTASITKNEHNHANP